jgi:uncharacterized membrane protein SpoIIM required for sporulation
MDEMGDAIAELYKQMAWPLVGIISGFGVLLGIWLGTSFILSDGDEQKLKKSKAKLKYVIIGFVVMFAVAALLPAFIGMLETWAKERSN